MKSDNKGFTIIELIVVMLIIGIVTTIVGLNISTTSSAKAKRCATSVNSLISKCRADSLGRSGNVYLKLSLDSDGNIVCEHSDGTTVSTETFSGSGISVTYTTTAGKVALGSDALHSLTLKFNRSTGGQNFQADGVSYCTAINFTSGRTYSITLVPSTGTHKLV